MKLIYFYLKNDYLYDKILVQFGADISVKNYKEQMPRDLAKQVQLLELLSQFPEPLVNVSEHTDNQKKTPSALQQQGQHSLF